MSSTRPGSSKLPHSVFDSRRHVNIHAERVSDVSNTEYPGHYPDEDHSWNLEGFKQKLCVEVKRLSQRSVEFDLVGVDASIANAFRRILISEVPTMAIEHVYVWNNTSVIHDEVLAHRIGLVPLNADPRLFEFRKPDNVPTDRNTLVFRLNVTCEYDRSAPKQKGTPRKLLHEYIRSGDLQWEPQGEQESLLAVSPGPTNKDIVLSKMAPGQEIELELHAIKGVGKEHAKWSPVATASYRLHPLIILNASKPVPQEHKEKFIKCFNPGVIQEDEDGDLYVNVEGMRKESMSREVFRHKEFDGCVELKRIRDWFIFTVESEGPYAPEDLLPEAITVMRSKIASIRQAAEALLADADAGGLPGAASGVAAAADGDVEMSGV